MRHKLKSRIQEKYRAGGARGLFLALRDKTFGPRVEADAYQSRVAIAARWEKIRSAMPPSAATLLDVGCNLGDITALGAGGGLWSIGVDNSPQLISKACSRHHGVANCGFALMNLSPGNVGRLPHFDVILLLSVHHHWVMAYGPDAAASMLREISTKANLALMYEGPSRTSRYGPYPPSFVDNEEMSVLSYHDAYLREVVGDLFTDVRQLGKSECVGAREPYRWGFALYRRKI